MNFTPVTTVQFSKAYAAHFAILVLANQNTTANIVSHMPSLMVKELVHVSNGGQDLAAQYLMEDVMENATPNQNVLDLRLGTVQNV